MLAPSLLGNEHQHGTREEDGGRVCRKLAVEGLGADYRAEYYKRLEPAAVEATETPEAAAVDAPLLPLVLAPARLDAADANAAAAAASES